MNKFFILDGAMGTVLMEKGLQPPFENLSLDQPELIKKIHQDYIDAGGEIILSHTFNAQTLLQCEAAWSIIKDLPVKKFISIGPEANQELIVDFFQDKADQFVFETIYSVELAKKCIRKFHSLNPIFSFCLKPADFKVIVEFMSEFKLRTIGLNCLNGFHEAEELLEIIPSKYEIFFKPNAGKSNLTPDEFSWQIKNLLKKFQLTYIGGCCGTTPSHIQNVQKVCRT